MVRINRLTDGKNTVPIKTRKKVIPVYNPQLETFLVVADSGSFSKAAEALYISPNAVIKQMNSLETNLGIILFERTHRGLLLTEAGKSFYRDSKYIIQYAKDSIIRAQNAWQKEGAVIRIGTSPMTPAQQSGALQSSSPSHCLYSNNRSSKIPATMSIFCPRS